MEKPESEMTPDELHEKAGDVIRKAVSFREYRDREWIKTGIEVGRLRALAAEKRRLDAPRSC